MSALPHSSTPKDGTAAGGSAPRDLAALIHETQSQFTAAQLAVMACGDVRRDARLAALVLGWTGGMEITPDLARALHHRDASVVRFAEDSLWRIWFRAAGAAAQDKLSEQIQQRSRGSGAAHIRAISRIIRAHPEFAEAYHQRAIVAYLNGAYESALRDYQRALQLNAHHFAARTGEGHCHVLMGRHRMAVRCYRAALQIHPRLEGVRQLIRRISEMDKASESGTTRRPYRLVPPPPAGSRFRK